MRLQKLHGLGNDFLVLLDLDGDRPIDADLARAVCERRRGIGADGLIHLGPGLRMTLLNADGSRAEMSGNGIRCLAHALARSRATSTLAVDIETDAGVRHVAVSPGADERSVMATVAMGPVRPALAPDLHLDAKDTVGADVGNPHVVALYIDRAALDVAADRFARTDRNVEFVIAGPGESQVTMRVVERGVGGQPLGLGR